MRIKVKSMGFPQTEACLYNIKAVHQLTKLKKYGNIKPQIVFRHSIRSGGSAGKTPFCNSENKKVKDSGKKIGHYQIIKRIGSGSFGKVYLAIDEKLHRRWALKEVPISVPDGEREGYLMNKLDHPGIPQIRDIFRGDENWYLVMEYVDGQTLASIIRNTGKVSAGQVLDWGIQICGILEYLHGLYPAVIHGDLKPENIMLNQEGKIFLIDFGAARELIPGKPLRWMGTKAYQPPEQQKGKFSEKNDIYMLGCVMKEIWNGHHGGGLKSVLRRCMRANPQQRYASAQKLRKALQEVQKSRKSRSRLLPEGLAGACILAGAVRIVALEVTDIGQYQLTEVFFGSALCQFTETAIEHCAVEAFENGLLQENNELLHAGIELYCRLESLGLQEDYDRRLRIARGYRLLGNKSEAVRWYKKAIELEPVRPEAYTGYGLLLLAEQCYEQAQELLRKGRECGMKPDENVKHIAEELEREEF